MSPAPHLVQDDGDWPIVAALTIAGLPCICTLAGAAGTSTARLDGNPVAILALSLPNSPRGVYQPLTRASGEALKAGIDRALAEAGL